MTETSKLAEALAKAQAEMAHAAKEKENPHFRQKYADLSGIWDACRGPLTKNGLSVVQTTIERGERLFLVTTLLHASGESRSGEIPLIFDQGRGNAMQALGSAITYARRYGLAAIVGVCPDDDDAQGAGDIKREDPPPPPPPPKISETDHKRLEAMLAERNLDREEARRWFALHGVQDPHLNTVPASAAAELMERIGTWADAEDLIRENKLKRHRALAWIEKASKGSVKHFSDLTEKMLEQLAVKVGTWKEDPTMLADDDIDEDIPF